MAKRKYLISIWEYDSNRILYSLKGTKRMLVTLLVSTIVLLIILIYVLTALTPIKYTIPGYPSEASRQQAMESLARTDSLERVISLWNLQMTNIRRIVDGREPLPFDSISIVKQNTEISDATRALYSGSDSLIRNEVLNQEKTDYSRKKRGPATSIEGLHFFTPIQGIITQQYDKAINHPYLDIASEEGSIVYSVLDGTVVAAFWDELTGNNIMIQHSNDILTICKHNEKLLKKTGDVVRSGEPVAIVGNTGKISTGTHLHFELWYKGEAINPENYIKF